jgi:hypothetical protein
VVALAALAFCLAPARAQRNVYCNVTRVSARQLTNAVQITIQADGAMRVAWNQDDYFDVAAFDTGGWAAGIKPITTLPLQITNARSRVPRLTDLGMYPASHVEVSAPPTAPDGIGLNVTVGLYVPARTVRIQTPDEWDFTWANLPEPTTTITLSPDRTSLLIVVASDRQTQPPFVRRRAPAGAPVELSVSGTDAAVSIHALNAELKDLVRALAAATGHEVVLDGVLDHTVSMDLHDTPLPAALDTVAMAYGLSADSSGRQLRLTEGEAESVPAYVQGQLESIPLHYITAGDARNELPEFLLKYVHANEALNALTVTGPSAMVGKLKADLAALDQPSPRIAIEVTVVEFNSSADLDVALGIGARGRESAFSLDSDAGNMSFRSNGPLDAAYVERLSALESRGRARTLARPKATALNGHKATLFVGQQRYIKVDYFDADREQAVNNIIPVALGISLEATPWTGDGKTITVELSPQVTSVAETEARTGLPTVFTRNTHSTVRLMDGDTIVIGGVSMAQDQRSRRGILRLFRTPSHARPRQELALFVTARVVPAGAPADKLPDAPPYGTELPR